MEKKTIRSTLTEMKEVVEQGKIMPPDWWLDKATDLSVLWQDLKDAMTEAEMLYKTDIVTEIEQGKKISEATLIVEAKSQNYKTYNYLKGRDKIVGEFIMLAKARAKINTYV